MRKIIFILTLFSIISCKKKYVETIPTVSSTQINSPVSTNLNSISFISASEGFIGGDNGKVYKTNDAGASWTNISLTSSSTKVFKVIFLTSLKGFVATDAGIYMTIDGGTTWTIQLSNDINDIQFVSSNIGYAVGAVGFSAPAKVYKTFDGGNTWEVCNSPFLYLYTDLYAVSFVNQDTGYIAGDDAKFFETIDGGYTWTQFIVGSKWGAKGYSDKIYDLYFTGYRTGYVTGSAGYLNKIGPSTASTVSSTPLINTYDYNLTSVTCRNSSSVCVGHKSVLMPYAEFGTGLYSWTYFLSSEATTFPYNYNDVAFADDNNYFAVGAGGVITKFKYPN